MSSYSTSKKFNLDKLLIKIDVQGIEDRVLIGSSQFISKKVPLLVEIDYFFCQSFFLKKSLT